MALGPALSLRVDAELAEVLVAVLLPFAHMPSQHVAAAPQAAPLHVNTGWSLALLVVMCVIVALQSTPVLSWMVP